MKRIKSNKDFGCRPILTERSDTASVAILRVPTSLSGRYCLLATAQVLFFADMEPPQLPPKKSNH